AAPRPDGRGPRGHPDRDARRGRPPPAGRRDRAPDARRPGLRPEALSGATIRSPRSRGGPVTRRAEQTSALADARLGIGTIPPGALRARDLAAMGVEGVPGVKPAEGSASR